MQMMFTSLPGCSPTTKKRLGELPVGELPVTLCRFNLPTLVTQRIPKGSPVPHNIVDGGLEN